ncbi:hypothetical protein ACO3BK_001773 [Klebsiella pneumoniae]|nr:MULTISPECIES: hypothetical protein [Klebsiella]TYF92199.1 hypothetical protein DJ542_12770 [Klebsiella grimontii]SBH92423.1 Uncharacterised protein [Klebsiella pneumoniae]HDS7269986.1 hypothetical protein [Klebsiella pneumoniae subsp. pneumoniae]
MKIPTGNFGNVMPQAQPTRTDVSNAGAIGAAVKGFGDELSQQADAVIRARATEGLLDYQIKIKDVNESIRQGVEDGTIKADQIDGVYKTAVSKLEKPVFAGLDIAGMSAAQGQLKRYDAAGQADVQGLYRTALKIEAKDQVDSQLDQLGKLTNYPDADIEKINGMSAAFETQGRLAYGAQWGKVRQSWIDKNWMNHAQQQLMAARDNGGALSAFNNELTSEKGFYVDKLDPEKRNALLNQAMGYQARIEARAIAAQNHADMLALRRENAAIHASGTMQMRIANGEIPTDQDWNNYLTSVSGTSQDGTAPVLRSALLETQRLYSLPPEKAQAEVDSLALSLKKNGGSEIQYKVLNAVQSNIDHRRNQLQKNPQSVFAMDSGTPLQPLSPESALQQPGEWGAGLKQRQANSDAIIQKYGATAGKNLLTTEELGNAKDAYEKMSPDQRIQFWRNTQASSTPAIASRLAREIGGDSLQVSAVAGLASNPAGYKTALAVEKGSQLLNPVDGAPKVRLPASFDQDVADAIKKQYPTFSPAQVQRLIPVVRDYHIGTGGAPDKTPKAEALHEVIGKPVNVYGSYAIAPAGTDENTFIDALKIGVNRLGDSAQDVKNGLNQGVYGFVSDSDGNQVLINAATQRRVVGKDGRPIVIEVDK